MRPPVVARHVDGTITRISRWAFNCYVVHAGDAVLVVDPGTPANGVDAAEVVAGEHGVGTVPTVFCTHGHLDHVAGVPPLLSATGAGYLLPAPCESLLAGDHSPGAPGLREVAKIAPVLASQPFSVAPLRELGRIGRSMGHTPGGMAMPVPPTGFLADGDEVPGLPGWTVLLTPGHVEDSTCLYHAESATLLSGDTVLTHEGRAWINPEVLDASAQAATEERLRALPVEHLLPGHGLPVSGDDLLGRARSFTERPPGPNTSERLARLLGAW